MEILLIVFYRNLILLIDFYRNWIGLWKIMYWINISCGFWDIIVINCIRRFGFFCIRKFSIYWLKSFEYRWLGNSKWMYLCDRRSDC